jgi:hypothetical protein
VIPQDHHGRRSGGAVAAAWRGLGGGREIVKMMSANGWKPGLANNRAGGRKWTLVVRAGRSRIAKRRDLWVRTDSTLAEVRPSQVGEGKSWGQRW